MVVAHSQTPNLDALMRRHQMYVWRYLRVLGCSSADADELTQEAFTRLLEGSFEERFEAATRSYLTTAARQLFLQMQAKRARHVEVGWTDAVDAWFEQQCKNDDGEAWLTALSECTARMRGRGAEVLHAFYGDGRSRAEVAAKLGMKENGVKTLLQRLRAQLRACVERRLAR